MRRRCAQRRQRLDNLPALDERKTAVVLTTLNSVHSLICRPACCSQSQSTNISHFFTGDQTDEDEDEAYEEAPLHNSGSALDNLPDIDEEIGSESDGSEGAAQL